MKIAINCAFFQPRSGGIKEYILNLVTNLAPESPENEYVVYVLREFVDFAKKHFDFPNVRIKEIPFGTGSLRNKIARSLLEHRFWRKEEKTENWDLFHSPFFHSPNLRNTKTVITVHDLRFYRFPETYNFFRANFLKYAVKRSIRKADGIITISQFTKDEILDAYGVDPSKITPILEAIDCKKFSADTAAKQPDALEGERFLLCVGQLEPRKNYDRLIPAFKALKSRRPELADLKLVIVGRKECRYENTIKLIEENPDVKYLNFVSDENLMWLYRNAELFVFPSTYEGFGFPPLEAASLGLVSAVSDISSIPEVCGDCVAYFDPFDISDISTTLERVLTDEEYKSRLKSKIADQLGSLSWQRNAKETLNVYNNTLML